MKILLEHEDIIRLIEKAMNKVFDRNKVEVKINEDNKLEVILSEAENLKSVKAVEVVEIVEDPEEELEILRDQQNAADPEEEEMSIDEMISHGQSLEMELGQEEFSIVPRGK